MWKLILYLLLFWFLYNLIFRFIIPVYRTSSQLKKKFREMNDHMQQEQRQHTRQQGPEPASARRDNDAQSHDYIDFEEVK